MEKQDGLAVDWAVQRGLQEGAGCRRIEFGQVQQVQVVHEEHPVAVVETGGDRREAPHRIGELDPLRNERSHRTERNAGRGNGSRHPTDLVAPSQGRQELLSQPRLADAWVADDHQPSAR
nr:hypothetical protein [Actinocrispum wychmicini]